jgi:hypothetical protein
MKDSNPMSIEKELAALRVEINRHNDLYFQNDALRYRILSLISC